MNLQAPEATRPTPGDRFRLFLATAGGLGLSPVGPGSCAALAGVLIHVLTALLLPPPWQFWALGAALAAVCAVHFWLSPWASRWWQRHDCRHFVLDEVAGYLVVPLLFWGSALWQVALYGYILFRVFDIIKLPGARQIDRRMKNAAGELLDDFVSAAYATAVLYGLAWLSSRCGWQAWLVHLQ